MSTQVKEIVKDNQSKDVKYKRCQLVYNFAVSGSDMDFWDEFYVQFPPIHNIYTTNNKGKFRMGK